MASLTETAYYTRRTINWAILALIAYIVLRIGWFIAGVLFLILFPPKPPPPNHAFQRLPAIKFPAPLASPSGQLTFRLETISGAVPAASNSAAVYFMPKVAANLLALNKTQEFAKRLNLNTTPQQESKNIYRFVDAELPLRRLRYDIVSGNFVLRYAFEQDTGIFAERNVPRTDRAIPEAQDLLSSHNLYNEELKGGTAKVTFLRLVGDRLVTTTSQSQSDAVRIDFFRRPVGNTPIVTPFADEAGVSIVYSGSTNFKKHIIQFAYTFWPIDYNTTGTYELKPSSQAWEELQRGLGHIARNPRIGTAAVVRKTYLAYYDSYDPQTYLQPVFVFEGDDGFVGYVPAVVSAWVQ